MANGVNPVGADWLNLRNKIMGEIDASRDKLETALPVEQTVFERGRVAAFRQLIEFVEPVRTPDTEDVNYG